MTKKIGGKNPPYFLRCNLLKFFTPGPIVKIFTISIPTILIEIELCLKKFFIK